MSPYSVLSEPSRRGRPPRRRRVWPWVLVVLVVLAAAVAVPTALDHASDEGNANTTAKRSVGGGDDSGLNGKPSVATSPNVNPTIAAYARHPISAADRVTIHFKVPPTAGLLFDVRTGKVLWARHPNKVLSIASLTKMMTALLVVRNEPADADVRVTKQALAYKGSAIGILPNGRVRPPTHAPTAEENAAIHAAIKAAGLSERVAA